MSKTDGKSGAGRPTKHTEELLEKAREYLLVYESKGEVVPSIVGLAFHCKIAKQRVYDWIKDEEKTEFRDIAREVEQVQELKLASGGLTNVFNSNITKLLLSKHGYSDRQEVDHTSGGEKISKLEITMV
jgi:hypothetical protein